MAVYAAHGGAGATTLARALHVPVTTDPGSAAVLVVAARTTADAATAVLETVAGLPEHRPVVLALTGDGPLRPPAAVAAMRRLLDPRLAGVVERPWQPRWRHEHPRSATADKAWTAAAVRLHRLALDLAARTDHEALEGALP